MGKSAQVVCSLPTTTPGLGLVAAAYLWVQTATPDYAVSIECQPYRLDMF